MKKLLALVVLAGIGFVVYRYVLTSATERSCQRLASLCGRASAVEGCVRGMTELGRTNKEAAGNFDRCVADAQSCAAAMGCGVGAGLSAARGVLDEFVRGIEDAVKKK
jgi:hypothetical protein